MPVTNADKLDSKTTGNVVPFYTKIPASGEKNPYKLDWASNQIRDNSVRLLSPFTGTERKRRSPEAQAVLGWYLNACWRSEVIESNDSKTLKGHYWLWQSYASLSRIMCLSPREVQTGVGILRDNDILKTEMYFVWDGPGKNPDKKPGKVTCFRMVDDALSVTSVLAHWWWCYRDYLSKIDSDPDQCAKRARAFYRDALQLACDPPSGHLHSLSGMVASWFENRKPDIFQDRFRDTLTQCAKHANLTL